MAKIDSGLRPSVSEMGFTPLDVIAAHLTGVLATHQGDPHKPFLHSFSIDELQELTGEYPIIGETLPIPVAINGTVTLEAINHDRGKRNREPSITTEGHASLDCLPLVQLAYRTKVTNNGDDLYVARPQLPGFPFRVGDRLVDRVAKRFGSRLDDEKNKSPITLLNGQIKGGEVTKANVTRCPDRAVVFQLTTSPQ